MTETAILDERLKTEVKANLNRLIPVFRHNEEANEYFDNWIDRWGKVIERDGVHLSEAEKQAIIINKLGDSEHSQFRTYMLPTDIYEVPLKQTQQVLRFLFKPTVSLFSRRMDFFQTQREGRTLTDLLGIVNTRFERAEMDANTFTTEHLKCFIFISALNDPEDAALRQRAIRKMDEQPDTNLRSLHYELQKFLESKRSLLATRKSGDSMINEIHAKTPSKSSAAVRPANNVKCYRCGRSNHNQNDCRFREAKCHNCAKTGHLAIMCRLSGKKTPNSNPNRRVNRIEADKQNPEIVRKVMIDNMPATLTVDTGAAVTLIPMSLWKKLGSPGLEPSSIKLTTASGGPLLTHGKLNVRARMNGQEFPACCYVTDKCALLGRDWLVKDRELMKVLAQTSKKFDTPIETVKKNCVGEVVPLPTRKGALKMENREQTTKTPANAKLEEDLKKEIQQKFPAVFNEGLGKCTTGKVRLSLKENTKPIFRKARSVPYAVLPALSKELERLVKLGVLKPTTNSEFAAPVVVVRKKGGEIRLCADFSTGLNNALQDDKYPLPTAQDIFSRLAGGKFFSKIDLAEAYLQIEVHPDDRNLITINTPKGLFEMTRLPFGLKTAPSLFQRIMDETLVGIPGTAIYLDDILVTGRTAKEHRDRVLKVMAKIQKGGFRIRMEKCSFLQKQIKYLGFIIDEHGRRPDPAQIRPIVELPTPKDAKDVQAFLGLVTFYSNFIPDMKRIKEPLTPLLRKNVKFVWTERCEEAFEQAKKILQSDLALTHYDPQLPLEVSADASQSGVGGVLLHTFPDGSKKAIMHVNKVLTETEKRYGQIEKEALALVFAVKKFHKYIYGRHFILNTDHKPLLSVFKVDGGLPGFSANRLQRWALILAGYDFTLRFKNTTSFGEADALSRLIKE
ncbi:uncharacterized protein K02A2.6-like, partial [Galendromus occidentalis]|uniref:RNA-directed DNA polymerase n=1 Tax=Galendromus occidentalis TaxID=34638 RepID=A0AAJ6VWM5_9ACAR